MALYLGSEEKLPIIPYDQVNPAFFTHELFDREKPVLRHFSLPHVIYIGSNSGCGCSFRHVPLHKGEWVKYTWSDEIESAATQNDHQSLFDYLKNTRQTTFEIHACWEDDFHLPAEFYGKLNDIDLTNTDFFFKERGHYWIQMRP